MYDPTPRWKKILDALSQLGNVSNPFADHTQTSSDESISGRAHRQCWAIETFIDLLFRPFEANHSRRSYEADVQRAINVLNDYEARK